MNHLPLITIQAIPHQSQRYNSVGDYQEIEPDCWDFTISETNADYEFLVLIHELVEWFLTQRCGITEKEICAFDMAFEKNRKPGNTDEPGHDPKSPYIKEHQFAEKIERLIAKELSISWKDYEKTLNML